MILFSNLNPLVVDQGVSFVVVFQGSLPSTPLGPIEEELRP